MQPRRLVGMWLPQSFDSDFELLPFFGGDVASRLADLMLDLENFGLLSGDLDSGGPAAHCIDQPRVLRRLRRLSSVGACARGTCEGSHSAGVASRRCGRRVLRMQSCQCTEMSAANSNIVRSSARPTVAARAAFGRTSGRSWRRRVESLASVPELGRAPLWCPAHSVSTL